MRQWKGLCCPASAMRTPAPAGMIVPCELATGGIEARSAVKGDLSGTGRTS